ncbi:DUF6485 family protein [Maridesulfovibrio bastinii]|uniref:DUF6485 family protein n=1 Tax=Maridesulfovibrio bastinii TaxID=47157 RepID=UPI000429BE5C|nr:DUF6485 family protein [Maridesulfovibrio bastinii]
MSANKTCVNIDINNSGCPCTNLRCPKHGVCCECIAHHKNKDQLPACYFTAEQEKTYDRSIDYFIKCRTR